jgi:hypothetical protein
VSLADPRIGRRKGLVRGFLHMIEDDHPDHRQNDGRKARSNKRLHGMFPFPI